LIALLHLLLLSLFIQKVSMGKLPLLLPVMGSKVSWWVGIKW